MTPWILIDAPKLGPKVSGDEMADQEYYVLTVGVESVNGTNIPARRWEVDGNQLPCYAEITKRINP